MDVVSVDASVRYCEYVVGTQVIVDAWELMVLTTTLPPGGIGTVLLLDEIEEL